MRKIVIFGASLGGERGLKSLSRGQRAIAFCDNDASKHGTKFHGLPVVGTQDLNTLPYDRILIASRYYPEIFNQIVDLGIAPDRIDILALDALGGADDPTSIIYWVLAGVFVVIGLAIYGLIRLLFG